MPSHNGNQVRVSKPPKRCLPQAPSAPCSRLGRVQGYTVSEREFVVIASLSSVVELAAMLRLKALLAATRDLHGTDCLYVDDAISRRLGARPRNLRALEDAAHDVPELPGLRAGSPKVLGRGSARMRAQAHQQM